MTDKKKAWQELPPEQIERAVQGSRKDLDALVRCYGPVVWGAVAARVRRIPALAVQMEDLVGSVWLELCRNDRKRLRYYDRARGEFGYFIRLQAGQIAWNQVVRELNRLEVLQEATSELDHKESEQHLHKKFEQYLHSRDLLERVAQRAKARLSESDWALFNAAYLEGLSSEELAERLDKKVKTVYQQRYRLQAKLEAIVRELLEESSPTQRPNEPLVLMVVASLMPVWFPGSAGVDPQETDAVASTFTSPDA